MLLVIISCSRTRQTQNGKRRGDFNARIERGGKIGREINAGRTAAAIFQPASRHFIRNFLSTGCEEFFFPIEPELSCNGLELRSFLTRKDRDSDYEMADRRPSGVKEIMRSTWSWACRPRDRCPRSAIYTPGYPAVEEGPSLPMGLPRRPPVVPDGNRAHPSARNQMSCHAVRPFPYRVKKR